MPPPTALPPTEPPPEDPAEAWRGEAPGRLGRPGPRWAGTARPAASAPASAAAARGSDAQAPPRRGGRARPWGRRGGGGPGGGREPARIAGRPAAAASFGRRAAGYLVDVALLVVVMTLVTAAAGVDFEAAGDGDVTAQGDAERLYLVILAVRVAYYWTWNALGWSPGKRLLGLRLVREDGAPPGVGPGFARTVISLVSDLALGIGYLWAAWDRRGQTWHDKMAGTYVVRAGDERSPGEVDGPAAR